MNALAGTALGKRDDPKRETWRNNSTSRSEKWPDDNAAKGSGSMTSRCVSDVKARSSQESPLRVKPETPKPSGREEPRLLSTERCGGQRGPDLWRGAESALGWKEGSYIQPGPEPQLTRAGRGSTEGARARVVSEKKRDMCVCHQAISRMYQHPEK